MGQGQGGQALGPEGATASCDLEPLALIARLAALVPPPRRHLTCYCGVLSSHARLRSQVVPQAPTEATAMEHPENPARKSKYIPWAELLRRTFAIDIKCTKCGSPLRLIALIKTREVIEKILRVVESNTVFPLGSTLPPRRSHQPGWKRSGSSATERSR